MNTQEKAILEQLEADADLWEQLTEDPDDWTFEPDASCDDGVWSDDSIWHRFATVAGQEVTIYAEPDYGPGWSTDNPTIGEPCRVEILQSTEHGGRK